MFRRRPGLRGRGRCGSRAGRTGSRSPRTHQPAEPPQPPRHYVISEATAHFRFDVRSAFVPPSLALSNKDVAWPSPCSSAPTRLAKAEDEAGQESLPGRLHQRDAQVERSEGTLGRWEVGRPPDMAPWNLSTPAPWRSRGCLPLPTSATAHAAGRVRLRPLAIPPRADSLTLGLAFPPSLSFCCCLVRPLTEIFLLYGGCAEKDVTTIRPLALQAPLPSPGWRRLGSRAGTGRHARAADTGMSTPAGNRSGPVQRSAGVLAVLFNSHRVNQVVPSPLYR